MDINQKHATLEHLTVEQIEALIERYYAGEKISNLINEYELSISTSKLVGLFPPLIHYDQTCPHCNLHMISTRKSRTYSWVKEEIYCPNCKHQDSSDCKCSQCVATREILLQAEEKLKRELIRNTYVINDTNTRDLVSLSLRERVLVGTLLRNGLEEDYAYIKSLELQKGKLSPNATFDLEILKNLYHNNIILVHPESPLNAFVEREEIKYPDTFNLNKVFYHVNVCSDNYRLQTLNQLTQPSEIDFSGYLPQEFYNLWKEIAFQECIEYLLYSVGKVGFSCIIAEKTTSIFYDLLDSYSTSQVFAIIFKSVADTSKFYLENKLTKKHAGNIVISNCQKKGERYLSNNWNVTGFKRDFNCPQSTLSQFYYDRVLRIGNNGFEKSPMTLLTEQ